MRERSSRPGSAGRRGGRAPGRSTGPASSAAVRPLAPASPAAARPAARRVTGGRAGETTRTSVPRPPGRITGRAAVLAVVLVALALSYVFPLRVYLAQQAEISQLRAAQDAQRAHIAELAEQAALWRDEDYIRSQARRRFHYGEPGEILMITVWEEEVGSAAGGPDTEEAPDQTGPWWDTLWSSIEAANGVSSGSDQ